MLIDVRRAILVALGLAAACGSKSRIVDGDGEAEADSHGTAAGWPPSPNGTSEAEPDATTTTSASTSTSASGESDGGSPPVICEGGVPILQTGVRGSPPTGFEICEDGRIHRVEAIACGQPRSPEPSCSLPDSGECLTDADCTAAPFGRCVDDYGIYADPIACRCEYGCASDADCDADEVCACGGEAPGYPPRSSCVDATCTSDDECGDFLCAMGMTTVCGGWFVVACLTPWDQCTTNSDCNSLVEWATCLPEPSGEWACDSSCGCCGRPLLVDGRPVTAAAVPRTDWAAPFGSSPGSLPTHARQRIAEHFTRAAQLEHASVGSFARFTLELLAIGAPPSLLEAAQRAGLDEVEHARRCFALAQRYSGVAAGPGPLPTTGVVPASSLPEVIAAVIEEGCIGETLAAVEAHYALVHAIDPEVRCTLEVIARDELRHAVLGWQTLAWALETVDAQIQAQLLDRLDAAIARAERDRPTASVDPARAWLRAHGVLDPADRRAARTEALALVLRPSAAALREAALRSHAVHRGHRAESRCDVRPVRAADVGPG